MSRLLRSHAEKLVLLPLIGAVIAGIISLSARATLVSGGEPPPSAEDQAAR